MQFKIATYKSIDFAIIFLAVLKISHRFFKNLQGVFYKRSLG